MSIVKDIKKLCTPAYVYLVISAIAMIGLILQNAGNVDKYCVGSFECGVPNTAMVFVGKALYIAFWTFVLNSLCKGWLQEHLMVLRSYAIHPILYRPRTRSLEPRSVSIDILLITHVNIYKLYGKI